MDTKLRKAFQKTQKMASSFAKNSSGALNLIKRAEEKANLHQNFLSKSQESFKLVTRLVRAWAKGEYKDIPLNVIVTFIAALIYFINPMDIIPDFISGPGFIDDITVLSFVIHSFQEQLDNFKNWEKNNKIKQTS